MGVLVRKNRGNYSLTGRARLGVVHFIMNFAAAMIEPTTEAYFLDLMKSKKEEVRFYGPYNTSIDFSYFVGELISGGLLLFLGFKYLFLLFGFFMLVMVAVSLGAREVVEARRGVVE